MAARPHAQQVPQPLNDALANEIGRVDAIVKAAEAELKALKDEFKARGLKQAAGEHPEVTAIGSIEVACCANPTPVINCPAGIAGIFAECQSERTFVPDVLSGRR
jgi:hypothetical protein